MFGLDKDATANNGNTNGLRHDECLRVFRLFLLKLVCNWVAAGKQD